MADLEGSPQSPILPWCRIWGVQTAAVTQRIAVQNRAGGGFSEVPETGLYDIIAKVKRLHR